MTKLSETFMPVRPAEIAVTVLDTDDDIFDYLLDGGAAPDNDGNVLVSVKNEQVLVPLRGLYRLQVVADGVTVRGPVLLTTPEQFKENFTAHDAPYYEHGVQFVPRPRDIVVHGTLDAARAALDVLPVLKASGDYAIVRRLAWEPGYWERVE